MYDITMIGAAIVDVLASPVNQNIFTAGSQAMEDVKMSFGGDALNEAVVLSRLGKKVQLISKVGDDEAGKRVLSYINDQGISTDSVKVEAGLATGINIVLIDDRGERHFLTNPNSNLRKLSFEDVEHELNQAGNLVSFASMFVSPLFTIEKLEQLFRKVKAMNRILFVDMTKRKNGETLADIRQVLPYIDYLVPNEEEISLITGEQDPIGNIKLLLDAGVKNVIVKLGAKGCMIGNGEGIYHIPAVAEVHCVDTTGAGDSFAAGFLYGISKGWNVQACGRFACAVASCAVEQIGAVDGVKDLDMILERYESYVKYEDH